MQPISARPTSRAPTVLAHGLAPWRCQRRYLHGVGLGIAASGTLVRLLLDQGLTRTWIGLGALALILTLFAWTG
jgi:hypothetical protein